MDDEIKCFKGLGLEAYELHQHKVKRLRKGVMDAIRSYLGQYRRQG